MNFFKIKKAVNQYNQASELKELIRKIGFPKTLFLTKLVQESKKIRGRTVFDNTIFNLAKITGKSLRMTDYNIAWLKKEGYIERIWKGGGLKSIWIRFWDRQ